MQFYFSFKFSGKSLQMQLLAATDALKAANVAFSATFRLSNCELRIAN